MKLNMLPKWWNFMSPNYFLFYGKFFLVVDHWWNTNQNSNWSTPNICHYWLGFANDKQWNVFGNTSSPFQTNQKLGTILTFVMLYLTIDIKSCGYFIVDSLWTFIFATIVKHVTYIDVWLNILKHFSHLLIHHFRCLLNNLHIIIGCIKEFHN